MEVGRVDSDEHYLTQPPEVFKFMQELDNVLYDIGENFACVDTIVAAYQGVGDIYVYLDCNGNTRFYSASGRCNGKSEQGNMKLPYGLITEEMRSKTLWEDGVKDILSIYFFQ
ncbi:MAG: hypothetical protein K6E91_11735 [Butyrivibrio sp.]|nr:hypothetical protein [Butyrivibrio sp.]